MRCRYMYQHGYNISLVDMVDRVASPLVKQFLTSITYKKLDVWPTPADYAHAVSVSATPLLLFVVTNLAMRSRCALPALIGKSAWTQAVVRAPRSVPLAATTAGTRERRLHTCTGVLKVAACRGVVTLGHACVIPQTAVPKMRKLWASFYQAYAVDVVAVPTLPTTARPIDDVEPYMTFNGRKASRAHPVWPCLQGCQRTGLHPRHAWPSLGLLAVCDAWCTSPCKAAPEGSGAPVAGPQLP